MTIYLSNYRRRSAYLDSILDEVLEDMSDELWDKIVDSVENIVWQHVKSSPQYEYFDENYGEEGE